MPSQGQDVRLRMIVPNPRDEITTPILDNFNRSDRPLDGNWADWWGGTVPGVYPPRIINNQLVFAASATQCNLLYDVSFGASQECYVDLVPNSSAGNNTVEIDCSASYVDVNNNSGYTLNVYMEPGYAEVLMTKYRRQTGFPTSVETIAALYPSLPDFSITGIGISRRSDGYLFGFYKTTGPWIYGLSAFDITYFGGKLGLYFDLVTAIDDFGGGTLL